VLAGGQSLIPAMRFRLARPPVLVDINPVAELAYLRESDGHLLVGAATRDFAVETAPFVPSRYHLIADASVLIADPVVRQMGTVVGSLCHNDPSGDWPAVALASRASVVCAMPRARASWRSTTSSSIRIRRRCRTAKWGEVRFPTPGERTSGSYQKIERKVGDFATESAAAQVTLVCDGTIAEAGVSIGALGPRRCESRKPRNC